MTKLGSCIMIPGGPGFCKKHGIGPQAERWLLEQYNCSLGNTGNAPMQVYMPHVPYESKNIISIFGYPESWKVARETYRALDLTGVLNAGQWYYYNCGDGAWLGLDEPWTRVKGGDLEIHTLRCISWGRVIEHLNFALNFLSGTKPVVTHPRSGLVYTSPNAPKLCDLYGNKIVYAFDTHIIAEAETLGDWRTVLDIPADAEVWAYNAIYPKGSDPYYAHWMSEWTPTPTDKPELMGPWLRERGISAWLHNANIKYLVDSAATDPRQMLSVNGAALLKSIVEAE